MYTTLHKVLPDNPQTPYCESSSITAEASHEIIPVGLSNRARLMMEKLEGTAYLFQTNRFGPRRYALTDETLDLDHPRWEGRSLRELNAWLENNYKETFER